MPYKCEKLKVPKELDRRRKLSDEDRAEIKKLYGKISQRKLAEMFGVSRRLIIFIGCPEKHQRNLQMRADSGGSMQYYDRKKHKNYMKNHRRYKQSLFLDGRLGDTNE